jgi:hypothetical protein
LIDADGCQAWAAISRIAYAIDAPTPRKTLVFFHSIGLDIIEPHELIVAG